jgi:pyridoxal/pyridoxine/pyridoxamine kinase
LESKGIELTLGIGLVKQAQGTHKCAKESIKLTTPNRKELEYITEHVVTVKGAANQVKLNQLDANQGPKVPVVNEFLDVLPKALPVVPPD